MKKILSSLALACVLAVSMAVFAQDQMKPAPPKNDQTQSDQMKKVKNEPEGGQEKRDEERRHEKDEMKQN